MKLSLSTCALEDFIRQGMTPREVIEAISRCGFRCVDYDLYQADHDDPVNRGRELKRILADLGVTAPQAHAYRFHPAAPEICGEVGTMRNDFIFCRAAGIPALTVHPYAVAGNTREEFFSRNLAFYRSLLPFCEETGVRLLIENIGNPMDPYFLPDGKDLREMVDGVGHPLCSACWDIGHANHFSAEEHPQYESILALGNRLTAIHLHDNAGNFDDPKDHMRVDMHMIPYMTRVGSVNFDAVLNGLVDIGYQGTFNLELSGGTVRRFMTPFYKDGQKIDRLALPSPELWIKIYSTVYEIGRYMLETYGVFEG